MSLHYSIPSVVTLHFHTIFIDLTVLSYRPMKGSFMGLLSICLDMHLCFFSLTHSRLCPVLHCTSQPVLLNVSSDQHDLNSTCVWF